MKKYIVNFVTDYSKDILGGGATAKAPSDILVLAKKSGFEEIRVHLNSTHNKIIKTIDILWQMLILSRRLTEKSIILFQYPFVYVPLVKKLLELFRKHYLVGLIHDINSIRVEGKLSSTEIGALASFDELYVHTANMQDALNTVLPKSIVYNVLGCFPYLADRNQEKRQFTKDVCFAGNLNKSLFLPRFIDENITLNILLYGVIKNPKIFHGKAKYLGHFLPNNIQHIKGSWGLVWDGEVTNCCGGFYGEYLRIIAPHKFSMYIAAELPVIVWKESAMAELVEKYGLGITVGSLSEISEKIDSLTEDDYCTILKNIRFFIDNKLNIVFKNGNI